MSWLDTLEDVAVAAVPAFGPTIIARLTGVFLDSNPLLLGAVSLADGVGTALFDHYARGESWDQAATDGVIAGVGFAVSSYIPMLPGGGASIGRVVARYALDGTAGILSDPHNPLFGGPAAQPPPTAPNLVNLGTAGCPGDNNADDKKPTGMYPVWAPPLLNGGNHGVSQSVVDQYKQLPGIFCAAFQKLGDPTNATPPPTPSSGTIDTLMNAIWNSGEVEEAQAAAVSSYQDLLSAFTQDFNTLQTEDTALKSKIASMGGPGASGPSGASSPTGPSASSAAATSSDLDGNLLQAKVSINNVLLQLQQNLSVAPPNYMVPSGQSNTSYEDGYALNELENALAGLHYQLTLLNNYIQNLAGNLSNTVMPSVSGPAGVGATLPAVQQLSSPGSVSGPAGATGPSSLTTPTSLLTTGPAAVLTPSGSSGTTAADNALAQQQAQDAAAQQQAAQQAAAAQQQAAQQAAQQQSQMEEQMAMEQMMQGLSSLAMQGQGLHGLEQPPPAVATPLQAVPQSVANPEPVKQAAVPTVPTGPSGPPAAGPDTGTSGPGHSGPAQRTPGSDGSVVYTFPDGRTQKVSPVVAQALDAAFSNAAGTDAHAAYARTPVTWQPQKNPGTRVDPNKLMTGDVCKWENRTALVVAFGPDSGSTLQVVVDGQLHPFAPELHDAQGDCGQWQGFFHPPGIEITAASAPDAGAAPSQVPGGLLGPIPGAGPAGPAGVGAHGM